MGILCILATLLLMGLLDYLAVRSYLRRGAGAAWWVALVVALAGGTAAGVAGLYCEYHVSPRLRVVGFPVPVVLFYREGPPGEEQWIDYVVPAPIALSNVLLGATAAPVPVWLAFLCWRRLADSSCDRRSRLTIIRPGENDL